MKKAFITISIFCLIAILSCPVFASNMMEGAENTLNGIRDGVQNMMNDAGNAAKGAKDGISNAINNTGDAVRNMGNEMTNDADNYVNNGGAIGNVTGDNYTANRTAAATDVNNTNNATVWVVLAIAAVLIIGLVWYYAAQIKNDRD